MRSGGRADGLRGDQREPLAARSRARTYPGLPRYNAMPGVEGDDTWLPNHTIGAEALDC